MSSEITYVATLDLNGLPIEPAKARKAFKRACGFQVRDNVSITIHDWRLVPEATKEQLGKNITENIKYLDDVDEEFVKRATLISMGQLFHRWKSDMNRKYVKKQLVLKHKGKITQAQWKKFVKQKTGPKVQAISGKFVVISKKNIYPHHLGSSGYVSKVREWKKKLEETVTGSKPNPLEGVEERTQHWILTWSNLTQDSTLVYKKKEVSEVQQKALQVVAKQRLGLFQSDRKMTNLRKLSATLNTQDTSAMLVLRCRGNIVF
jgi:hypothetical protein